MVADRRKLWRERYYCPKSYFMLMYRESGELEERDHKQSF